MVQRRAGDEITLLDSSIRTAGGAVVSIPLYVLSGVVYAVVTSRVENAMSGVVRTSTPATECDRRLTGTTPVADG